MIMALITVAAGTKALPCSFNLVGFESGLSPSFLLSTIRPLLLFTVTSDKNVLISSTYYRAVIYPIVLVR